MTCPLTSQEEEPEDPFEGDLVDAMAHHEMLDVTIEYSHFVDSRCPENGDEGTGRPKIHSLALFFLAPGPRLRLSPAY